MKDLEGKNILIIGASKGFDLISDTMTILKDGNADRIVRDPYHHYEKPYIFM